MKHPTRVRRLTKPLRHLSAFWLWPGGAIVPVFTVIGLALLLQGGRFDKTPAYAILLYLVPAQIWGMAYLLVAASFVGYLMIWPTRQLAVFAHTIGIILTGWWLLAFIIRYATDASTTPVNVVSWALYLFLLIRSGWMIDVVVLSQQSTMGRDTPHDELA